jgi:hypothetical protein
MPGTAVLGIEAALISGSLASDFATCLILSIVTALLAF